MQRANKAVFQMFYKEIEITHHVRTGNQYKLQHELLCHQDKYVIVSGRHHDEITL